MVRSRVRVTQTARNPRISVAIHATFTSLALVATAGHTFAERRTSATPRHLRRIWNGMLIAGLAAGAC